MARPKQSRRVCRLPEITCYKPKGIPLSSLEEVVLTVDEFEAMRLADLQGHYQKVGAEMMNVSRQTFGRILWSARKKVAGALLYGKALRIEGGEIEMVTMRKYDCDDCGLSFEMPHGAEGPMACPSCRGLNILTAPDRRDHATRKSKGRDEFRQGEHDSKSRRHR